VPSSCPADSNSWHALLTRRHFASLELATPQCRFFVGIEPDLRRAIVGHEAQDTHAATYMHPDARTLYAAVEKVAYRGLDLSPLYPAKVKPIARAAD
jgi:hypothetical protein